ncbi:porin [Hydrogenimonas cancrithermarum]|uniref:Porin n=1 Tax=Hydrogenimonas cancrithermarum TaxID=2993563 RepID=A0ABM8FJT3_9BACT|nr:porin [Hydrogenimonas cancrithermarum]
MISGEDPLVKQQDNVSDNASFDMELYGSIRIRYRHVVHDTSEFEDSGSRIGLNSWYEFAPSSRVFARYELGFNLLQELGFDDVPYHHDQEFNSTLFTRLGYVGVQFDKDIVTFGKNWSTYYQVAGFTDHFDSFGGEASGAYNVMTDGGSSGTGRADSVLQVRLNYDLKNFLDRFEKLEINMQLQPPRPIPGMQDFDYNYGFGISTILTTSNYFSLGVAFNFSSVDTEEIPAQKRIGLNGNMSALLLGMRWYNDVWYLALTLSKSSNLQASDNLEYFDGKGMELYARYRFYPKFYWVGGINYLRPDSGQKQAGGYLLNYYIVGVRYSIKNLSRILYIESRIDNGRTYNNDYRRGHQITAGVRWDFDF